MRLKKKRYSEFMQELVEDYIKLGNPWPTTARNIARWMIKEGRWTHQDTALVKMCAHDIAKALRDESYTDPKGRHVRTKHAARVPRELADGSEEQPTLWADIRTAPRKFMELAFKQRRHQIVGDCKQLKTDVDSYNEFGPDGAPIRMLWDFTPDVEELETKAFEPAPIDPSIAAIVDAPPSSQSPTAVSSSRTRRVLSRP